MLVDRSSIGFDEVSTEENPWDDHLERFMQTWETSKMKQDVPKLALI